MGVSAGIGVVVKEILGVRRKSNQDFSISKSVNVNGKLYRM